mmetsp:Transcript_61641/g.127370  ORF Transcript_61641/g.127370 Transcript_61641/m.127370 type:complete len:435 (+) Transcript_61641:184-1488(+)
MNDQILEGQATLNIGTIGHVAHGKSTLVKAITGTQTVRFKNELERNITIKLGYANSKIFRCRNPYCPRPGCYRATGSSRTEKPYCEQCHYDMILVKHVSFIDCPGHEILMATMLNGASIMDAALLVIAANEPCPQPQTSEHLAAVEIMKMKNLIVLQNKVDLVSKKKTWDNYKDIKSFIKETSAESIPVIPISAQRKYNIDVLIETIVRVIPDPVRNFSLNLLVFLIRSFDINKPGSAVKDIKGGVVGGTIISGVLLINEEIEIRPGISIKDRKGKISCFPIKTLVRTLNAEKNKLTKGFPGGLLGIGTDVDPTLTRADRLSGQVLGHQKKLPKIFSNFVIFYKLFKRILGSIDSNSSISPLYLEEILMINIGSSSTGGKIVKKKKNAIEILLTTPICCEMESKVTLSRRIDKHWRLIGWGIVKKGLETRILEF